MGRKLRRTALGIAVAALVVGFALTSEARNPPDVFAGQIITSNKRIPTSAKSKGEYIKRVRQSRQTRFWENKERQEWKIYFAAFFRRPLNDLEVTVKIFDVTNGRRHMLSSFEQYLDRRGERVINSHIVLPRERFGVNKRILMVMENRGRTLAQAQFHILGEGPKYTGEVDFTSDD